MLVIVPPAVHIRTGRCAAILSNVTEGRDSRVFAFCEITPFLHVHSQAGQNGILQASLGRVDGRERQCRSGDTAIRTLAACSAYFVSSTFRSFKGWIGRELCA